MTLKDLQKDNIKEQNNDVAAFIDELYTQTLSKYLKLHKDWYLNDRFVRGDHWIIYNKTLNKVQTLPISDGEVRRTINKIRVQLRGVKNFIKRSQPRWEAHPDDVTDEAYENARKTNKLIQYYYRKLDIKALLTDVIVSGLKYSVGFLEGGVTKNDEEVKLEMWHDDTFSILLDLNASKIQDCRFIIKAVKKPIADIENNKNYKVQGKIKSDDKEDGGSTYKELIEREKYGDKGTSTKDLETALVKECWIKWTDDNGKNHVKVFTVVSGQLVRVKKTDYRRYPIFGYNPEREPGSIYSDAWIKDLIQVNKSLDKTASQVESYIQRMLAGKFMIKQGVEVSTITDKGAEKIYYKGSTPPHQLNLQPLPSTPFAYIGNTERWIEEMGGQREASLGRVPGQVQSGKGIEALQSADAATVAEPIENLENFLKDVAEFILEILTDYQLTSAEIVEDKEKIKFIGDIDKEDVPEGAMQLKPLDVRVAIVPEVAYSEDVRFERLIQLASNQLIDPQTILEKLSVSNVSDIIERLKTRDKEGFQREMVKQKESHRSSGDAPEDTADLAHQENMGMAAGQQVPMTPEALWTPEHTELHLAFIQQNQDAYTQNQQLFDEHILNEQNYQDQGATPQEAQPQVMPQQGIPQEGMMGHGQM
jgi:hypothetical protein